MGLMNKAVDKVIGDEIGESIEVDFESDDLAAGRFLRLKVRLDICKPLMRGTTVNLGDGRGDRWCPIAYEFGDGARNQELRVSFSGRGVVPVHGWKEDRPVRVVEEVDPEVMLCLGGRMKGRMWRRREAMVTQRR
jgi:hypothetical protein